MAMRRIMEFISPLGDDLLFHRMRGEETLGRLFHYRVDLLSEKPDLDPDQLLGKRASVKVELPDGAERFFNGHVTSLSQTGVHGRYHSYQVTLRPWLWLLTRTADCRIFQAQSVPDILKAVFQDHPETKADYVFTADHRTFDYCAQYRESDFNFVSRLMEHEGIYYFFEHEENSHKAIFVDNFSAHSAAPGFEELPFFAEELRARPGTEYVHRWRHSREIRTGHYATTDYDFTRPGVDLKLARQNASPPSLPPHEVFDFPGGYVKGKDGEHYVGVRIEELQTGFAAADGSSNSRGLSVGRLFKLINHPRADQNIQYLVTQANYRMELAGYEAGEGEGASYSCDFSVIQADMPFRPERSTPKPVVQGPQTAVVVGPAGDEIYVDKYGRVKVQFFWDRLGKHDENSSCWMRVSHPLAGKNWGMIAIPRIGQEVIVDFLEGDPDAPIITGRVYNGDQMPPYELPTNMTQTGIKSRSSKGGTPANFNELRFEDKKGQEQVYLHAEKDMSAIVENDASRYVGRDDSQEIKRDHSTKIGRNATIDIVGTRNTTVNQKVTNVYNNGKGELVKAGSSEFINAYHYTEVDGWRHEEVKGKATFHTTGNCENLIDVDYVAQAANFKYATAGNVEFKANQFNRTAYEANDVFLGPNTGTYIGAASSTQIGGTRNTFLGIRNDLEISLKFATTLGLSVNLEASLGINATLGPRLNFSALGLKDEPVDLAKAAMSVDTQAMKVISGGGPGGPAASAASSGGAAAAVGGFGIGFGAGVAVANAIAAFKDMQEFPSTSVAAVLQGAAATIVGMGPQAFKQANPPDSSKWMPPAPPMPSPPAKEPGSGGAAPGGKAPGPGTGSGQGGKS
jgi:type VI secretion system secreted protein VgrG